MTPDRVVMADGTSMANMLAMAALIAPGDEVVAEHPTYEPMVATAPLSRGRIRSFTRASPDFAIDPDARRKRGDGALPADPAHQSAQSDRQPGRRGNAPRDRRDRGAGRRHVLVDEVYLDSAVPAQRSAALLGDRFVCTSSLTKVYGLSGLRCGWILAEPELAERMWRLNELFGVAQAHAPSACRWIALTRLDEVRGGHPCPARPQPRAGQRLLRRPPRSGGRADDRRHHLLPAPAPRRRRRAECALRAEYDTSIVPGRFFGLADHFRIGIGRPTDIVEAGLERLGAALDAPA